MEKDHYTDEEIKQILTLKKVGVVGISRHSAKADHLVPKNLSEQGYDITPINPNADKILGKKCYPDISSIEHSIDNIDIFRPSDQVLPIVQEAIKKNPQVIWLQEGIHNLEAEELAREHGIDIVFNRCMLAEHQRLM